MEPVWGDAKSKKGGDLKGHLLHCRTPKGSKRALWQKQLPDLLKTGGLKNPSKLYLASVQENPLTGVFKCDFKVSGHSLSTFSKRRVAP